MRLTQQFQGQSQRSRSPGPLMLTHIVCHIFWMARPTNLKLGIRTEDDPHQPQAPWPPRSKVKVARSHDQSEPSWPNAVPVSLEAGGVIPCWPNLAATLLVNFLTDRTQLVVLNGEVSNKQKITQGSGIGPVMYTVQTLRQQERTLS